MKIKTWFFSQPNMVFLGCLLAILTLFAGIALLSLSGWFISATAFAGLSAASAWTFNYYLPGAGVRVFSVLRIIARYGERVVTHDITFKMLSTLRVSLYRILEPLAPAHLLRYHSGELLNRMVSDVDTLDQLYVRIFVPIISAVVIMGLIDIYLRYFSISLANIICGMLLLSFILIPLIVAGLGKKTGEKQLVCNAHLRTQLVEGVQSLGELILLGQWKNHLEKISHRSKTLIKMQFNMACIQGFSQALLLILSGLTIVWVIYMATPLIRQHHLNGANLALIILAALAAFEAILPINLGAQYWGKITLAAKRLNALSAITPAILFPEKSVRLPEKYDISFHHISFSYMTDLSRRQALREFSLHIPQGEHLVLTGASGAGKSTIVHLLARFFDPQQGDICIGSIPIGTLAEQDLRSLMTLITQRPHLFSATLRDNLLLANPNAEDKTLIRALDQVQLSEWFSHLEHGLNTWVGEGGIQLSGGQLRRLAVARALLHDTPIWLLDEPTEGLDQDTAIAFWNALIPLMIGKTVIIIIHQIEQLPKNWKYHTYHLTR